MSNIYKPCPCGSGKKYKFCCKQIATDDPNALAKASPIFPIYECSIMDNWMEEGLAPILVVRQQPNLRFLFGMYIVDYYCLGLKNTFHKANVKPEALAEMKYRMPYSMVPFDYEDARSLILGSIQYAGSLGFEPQSDWKYSQYIVEAGKPFEEKFEYGKNGKPLYINGPDDDVPAIMNKLRKADAKFLTLRPSGGGLVNHP